MLVFEERGKPEFTENSRSRVENQQTQPTCDAGSANQTRDTLVEGERSHHCASPAPLVSELSHGVRVVANYSDDGCFLTTKRVKKKQGVS